MKAAKKEVTQSYEQKLRKNEPSKRPPNSRKRFERSGVTGEAQAISDPSPFHGVPASEWVGETWVDRQTSFHYKGLREIILVVEQNNNQSEFKLECLHADRTTMWVEKPVTLYSFSWGKRKIYIFQQVHVGEDQQTDPSCRKGVPLLNR